jgi:hypothetical protein
MAGLDYRYYEGAWTVLPAFDGLTAIKTGNVPNIDLTVANRMDNVGFVFSGYINVPTTGDYTFFTNSDDGSQLLIDGMAVVANDGTHVMQEQMGVVSLAMGYHAIRVNYFNAGGNRGLEMWFQGPGLGKQLIPNTAVFRSAVTLLPAVTIPGTAVGGLYFKNFEGTWTTLPAFDALTPTKVGTATVIDLTPRSRDDNFGLEFDGYISVPTDGDYTFFTNSNDGSRLFIDGMQIVDNDGVHVMQEAMGLVKLAAGNHALRVTYFNGTGGRGLDVSYQGPGITKVPVPAAAYFRSTTMPAVNAGTVLAGVNFKYYESATAWAVLPAFETLTPTTTPTTNVATIDITPRLRDTNFGMDFTGYINLAAAGDYTFFTSSDDGSKLYIDGQQVVDNDGNHGIQEQMGTVNLAAGYHIIRVTFYQGGSGFGLTASYSGPGIVKIVIPAGVLFRN